MFSLWRPDSPFMQKMTTVTNLIFLNILWIVCSLPILTLGASTTAMYSVLFAYRRKETDSVFKPFFSAFVKNFKQSTICWVVLLALIATLCYDMFFIFSQVNSFSLLSIAVVIVAVLVLMVVIYIFPQIAAFENRLLPMVKNSFLLFLLYPIPSIAMMILTLCPLILFLFLPQLFYATLIIWTLIGFSLCAYINSFLLSKIFQRYLPKPETE